MEPTVARLRCRDVHLTLRSAILDGTLRFGDPNGAVAQLGERRVRNAEVEGSIPFRSIGSYEPISSTIAPCFAPC